VAGKAGVNGILLRLPWVNRLRGKIKVNRRSQENQLIGKDIDIKIFSDFQDLRGYPTSLDGCMDRLGDLSRIAPLAPV